MAYRIDVISSEYDNISGIAWEFTIWVALRKTNRYSVGVWYHTNEPPTPRFRTYYPLKTGAQIWDAIEEQHSSAAEWEEPLSLDDAREVCAKLAEVDPTMAADILAEVERRFAPVASDDRQHQDAQANSETVEKLPAEAGSPAVTARKSSEPPSTLTEDQRDALQAEERQLGRSLTTAETRGVLTQMEVFKL